MRNEYDNCGSGPFSFLSLLFREMMMRIKAGIKVIFHVSGNVFFYSDKIFKIHLKFFIDLKPLHSIYFFRIFYSISCR